MARRIRNTPTAMLVGTVLLLGACVPLKGTLEVREPITLSTSLYPNDTDPCAGTDFAGDCEPFAFTPTQEAQLRPGRFAADLDMSDRSAIRMTLRRRGVAERTVRFDVPRNMRIPRFEGRFNLTASEVGQPVDLRGTVDTHSEQSGPVREYEFCTIVIQRWVCRGRRHSGLERDPSADGFMPVAAGLAHDKRRRRHCGWREFHVQGSRQVEFLLEHRTRSVALDLLRPGGTRSIAHFEGAQTETLKHYQYTGPCF